MKRESRTGDLPKSGNTGIENNGSRSAAEGEDDGRRRKLERFKEWIRAAPDIRNERVELIKKKIKKGTYNIKAEEIAKKILKAEDFF